MTNAIGISIQCCARACVVWRRYVLFCMLSQAKKQQRQQHTLNHCKIMFKQKRTQQPSGHFLIYYFALRQQMHNLSMQKKRLFCRFNSFDECINAFWYQSSIKTNFYFLFLFRRKNGKSHKKRVFMRWIFVVVLWNFYVSRVSHSIILSNQNCYFW